MTSTNLPSHPVALVTGGSRGLGLAVTDALTHRGWRVVVDARDARGLADAIGALEHPTLVTAVSGDVADVAHRQDLADTVARLGRLDLLVNNASILGPSPLPPLAEHPLAVLEQVLAVNTVAPLQLIQLLLPALRSSRGRILNVSSDAAVESYPGWGGYGSSKAALDALTGVLAVEEPVVRIYAFDPGDMNTTLHQQAYPGEDISDRPDPSSVIPAVLRLVEGTLRSGRYRASELCGGENSAASGSGSPASVETVTA